MRLAPSEEASAAVVGSLQDVRGHWDQSGRWVPSRDAIDREYRVEARAMTKLSPRIQLGAIVPYLRTFRRFGDVASSGGGVGDVTLLARYDFVRVGGENGLPGIALTFASVLPTGRPPERANDALGAETTGLGTWEAKPGIAIEKSWWTGWFVSASVAAGIYGARYRTQLLSFASGGKSFTNGLGIAAGLSYERDAMRSRASALLLGSFEIDDHWQIFGSFSIDFAGREQTGNRVVGLGLRRAWNVYE
jgi:hypothetical protein